MNSSFLSDIGNFRSFPGIQLGFNGHFMNFRRIPKFLDDSGDSTGLGTAKFTQPVLVQKLKNDFDLGSDAMPRTPALPGQVLTKGDGNSPLPHDQAKKF